MTTLKTAEKDSPTRYVDPVCGMDVKPGKTKLVSVHKGHSYWFCAEACRTAFEANPKKYLEPKSEKKKGWFERYLERMAKINKEKLGWAGPRCH